MKACFFRAIYTIGAKCHKTYISYCNGVLKDSFRNPKQPELFRISQRRPILYSTAQLRMCTFLLSSSWPELHVMFPDIPSGSKDISGLYQSYSRQNSPPVKLNNN
jgi:hypothetical protein